MKKKKWMIRWQADLRPDASMVPDETVFQKPSQRDEPIEQTTEREPLDSLPTSLPTAKKWKKSRATNMQIPLVTDDLYNMAENMVLGFDPSLMSFLQEEEQNVEEWFTYKKYDNEK